MFPDRGCFVAVVKAVADFPLIVDDARPDVGLLGMLVAFVVLVDWAVCVDDTRAVDSYINHNTCYINIVQTPNDIFNTLGIHTVLCVIPYKMCIYH